MTSWWKRMSFQDQLHPWSSYDWGDTFLSWPALDMSHSYESSKLDSKLDCSGLDGSSRSARYRVQWDWALSSELHCWILADVQPSSGGEWGLGKSRDLNSVLPLSSRREQGLGRDLYCRNSGVLLSSRWEWDLGRDLF